MQLTHTQMRSFLGAAALAAVVISCKASDLEITNPNTVSPGGAAADPTALQLLATGLITELRATRSGFITNAGAFGRESYSFQPTEGRSATHPLLGIVVGGIQKIDPTGFAVGPWGGQYNLMRDVYNFKKTVDANVALNAAQKAASLAFAQTLEGIMMFEIVQTHDTLGGITQVLEDPKETAPFVSRDSMYKFIIGSFDAATTNLAAGGTAFPFTLPPGFAGFNTPATFTQFVQAMKAKAAAHYATAGGGATQWNNALNALGKSFLNGGATTRAALDAGVYNTYAPAPDTPNGLTQATNTTLYAHMSIQADAQLKADGTPDNRYTAKIRSGLPSRQGPPTGDGPTTGSSTLGFSIWPTTSSSISMIRNEELILIRAEARLATGDKAGAIADLNVVRVNSGGLPPSTLTAASSDADILTGILYEKRYSLLMEGVRWIDARRYNRLNTLPLDVATGPNKNFVAKVNPIPQAECFVRITQTGDKLGPNGQNNCAP